MGAAAACCVSMYHDQNLASHGYSLMACCPRQYASSSSTQHAQGEAVGDGAAGRTVRRLAEAGAGVARGQDARDTGGCARTGSSAAEQAVCAMGPQF